MRHSRADPADDVLWRFALRLEAHAGREQAPVDAHPAGAAHLHPGGGAGGVPDPAVLNNPVLPFLLLFMGMTVRFAEDPKDLIRGKERA